MSDPDSLERLRGEVWLKIDARIASFPTDGINAEGTFNRHVQHQQACFVDGMRAARSAAMAVFNSALSRLHTTTQPTESQFQQGDGE